MNLSLEKIDSFRKQGLRPDVVGCFLNDRKILFVYHKEYNLWQIPQGGIDNRETAEDALVREMGEELGADFVAGCEDKVYYLGEDKIEFPKQTQDIRELFSDDGQQFKMIGKKYFFFAIPCPEPKLDLSVTEFSDSKWLGYDDAIKLSGAIYQSGKRRVTEKAIKLLKEFDLIE